MEKNKKAKDNKKPNLFKKITMKNPYEDKSLLWETAAEGIPSDSLGSYTGVPFEGVEPEQDADDI